MKKSNRLSYWFAASAKLPHGDGREVRIGCTHKVTGRIVPCRNGLHSSYRPLDALRYAPGCILYIIRPGGEIVEEHDKLASSERTYLARLDAKELLRKFARLCALDVLYLWSAPEVVVKFLKTGDPTLRRAAAEAAKAAAEAARVAAKAVWETAAVQPRATMMALAKAQAAEAARMAAEAAKTWGAVSEVKAAAESAGGGMVGEYGGGA